MISVKIDKQMPTTVANLRTAAQDICSELKADGYLVYVTSSREPANAYGAAVALDVLEHISTQLRAIGKCKKLVLLIHTNGGDLMAPWPIISQIREYCDELNVVVLNRALSAGTLISLAADKIIMGPNAFLSPVDPQGQIMINGQLKNLEVEDVTGYIEFIKTRVGLSGGSGLEKAFDSLTNEIPPTVIGSLYRTHALIRSLASKILHTRQAKIGPAAEKQIIENLTEKLFSHRHLISRKEAKTHVGLGEAVVFPKAALESKIAKLVDLLTDYLKLNVNFDPVTLLAGSPQYEEDTVRGLLLSSTTTSFVFKSQLTISAAPTGEIGINVKDSGWVKE